MTDIIWQDPPPTKQHEGTPGRVGRMVDALKARPGEWAKDPNPQFRNTQTVRKHRYPGTEWTARKRPDGQWDVYGRWVGEQ